MVQNCFNLNELNRDQQFGEDEMLIIFLMKISQGMMIHHFD